MISTCIKKIDEQMAASDRVATSVLATVWGAGEMSDEELASRLASFPPDQLEIMKKSLPQTDLLRTHDLIPDGPIYTLSGEQLLLSDVLKSMAPGRPCVINFGSYTWPPFRVKYAAYLELAREFQNKADFLTIYIIEAHPADGWQIEINEQTFIQYDQPKSLDERLFITNHFIRDPLLGPHSTDVPVYVDGLDNSLELAFEARPERLYIVENERIEFRGGIGPYQYSLPAVRKWLVERFSVI